MSAKSFINKKEYILESKLFLNGFFKDLDYWNFDLVHNRSELLSGLALEIWAIPEASSYKITSKEQVFLLDDEVYDYTGTKPSGIQIQNEKFLSQTWSSIFVKALQIAFKSNKDLFNAVINKEFNQDGSKNPFDKTGNSFRQPEKIHNELFVETSNNTDKKMSILKQIFEAMAYESDEIILFIE
jgi:hypothetical protein